MIQPDVFFPSQVFCLKTFGRVFCLNASSWVFNFKNSRPDVYVSKYPAKCFRCLLSLSKAGREIDLCFIWCFLYFHVLCYWKCIYVFNTLCDNDFWSFFGVKRHQYDLRRQTLCLANMKLGKIFQTVNFCFQLIHLPKAICLVASGLYKVSNMVNNLKKSLKNVLAEHQVREAS